jgi:hypothetical protein
MPSYYCGETPDYSDDSGKCVRENCHGLEIKCGTNRPDICTAIYQLGDKCLKYAKCGEVEGKCQQITNKLFDECKSCVEKCLQNFKNDAVQMFDCENKCPNQ